jgi:hypothetical protein
MRVSNFVRGAVDRVVPLEHLQPGLYWIVQHCDAKGVDHHAILDVGNRMGYRDAGAGQAMIIHQTPPSIRREPFARTGYWTIEKRILDERSAVQRLIEACGRPEYHLVGNNCEHFARHIATGVRESQQVQIFGLISILLGVAFAAARG